MSNTTVPISEWCKEIRVALARKEMNLQSVADEIGYSYTTITALISGRIVKDNYLDIAKKINEVLEVNVLPEKPQLPSDEWCGAVRAKLYENYYRRGDGWSVEDYPVTDETHRPAGTCITAAWNY